MHVLVTCMPPLPASIKKDRIKKQPNKRWRHHFPHYKSVRAFCCNGNQRFDPMCPKTLCSISPTPIMLHIKFDQDWSTGLRDIKVQKCEIFVTQGQVSKMSNLIRPKIELDRVFMPVLVTSDFHDDSIKNERARMETPFSHYMS